MPARTVWRSAFQSLSQKGLGRADLGPADLGPADLGPADLGRADLGPAAFGSRVFGSAFFSLAAAGILGLSAHASTLDAANCLTAAEQVDAGETLSPEETKEAHESCVRALAATGSVIQKYQFQEADFLITGKRDTF